jgi:predicted small lipoprotein YifL
MMQKFVTLFLVMFLVAGGVAACGKKGDPVYQKSTENSKSNG